ncbi:MAG: response regulator [Proteobacteria bacterium]|nr:response regulator [Pseudomonadota bacterium]
MDIISSKSQLVNIHLLILDKDHHQYELLSNHLKNFGFILSHAVDAEGAIALAKDDPVDMIIYNWVLEKLTGIDLCRSLKNNQITKQIPILLLNRTTEEFDVSSLLDAGFDSVISQPFTLKELISRMRAILRRTNTKSVNEAV